MIVQPGSAMALFVLRLAGLLSLEKSLGENSTEIAPNLTQILGNLDISSPFHNPSNISTGSFAATDEKNSSRVSKSPHTSYLLGIDKGNGFEDYADLNYLKSVKKGSLMDEMRTNKSDLKFVQDVFGQEEDTESRIQEVSSTTEGVVDQPIRKGDFKVKHTRVVQSSLNHTFNTIKRFNLSDLEPKASSLSLAARNRNTGFSPVSTKPVNNTAMLLSTHSVPGNINQHSLNSQFQAMQVPRLDFVTSDLEYLDMRDSQGKPSSDYHSDLSSRSLISPVPMAGHERSFVNYTNEMEGKEETSDQQVSVTGLNVSEEIDINNATETDQSINEKGNDLAPPNVPESKEDRKNFIKTGPSTISPSPPLLERNNPYPYGPKNLKDILKFDPISRPKELLEGLGNVHPEKNLVFVNNSDGETMTAEQNGTIEEPDLGERYFVKTEKPPVLFHFDKPGYSPKLPEASLPPTRAPTPSDPWDCSPRCPRYSLVDWTQDYDIRQYPLTTWISTVIIAENRILAELEGYMRVQDYFYGLNDRGQLLNMTVPFVTQIKHGPQPGVLNEFKDFTVSLYIDPIGEPLNYDLPTPISNEVLIDRLETKTVFVSGFEANVWEVTDSFLDEKVSVLMDKLRQNGEAFLNRYFYLASYSRPELYQPIYYELWIYATSFRDNVITTPPVAPRTRPPPNKMTQKSISKLCRGVECPPFDVLRTYRYGIQKRRYFDGLFATTSPGECQFTTVSVWKGFMPLHLYKHGINSHMEVIEATRPIGLIHIKEDSTSTTECPQNMTMAIYLPKRLHLNPPLTGYAAPIVSINALQDTVVYAYTVGGYLLEPARVRKELSDLKHRLTEFGACFKDDEYYVVVYDFIIRYHGRQNEIWVVAENCKATLNG